MDISGGISNGSIMSPSFMQTVRKYPYPYPSVIQLQDRKLKYLVSWVQMTKRSILWECLRMEKEPCCLFPGGDGADFLFIMQYMKLLLRKLNGKLKSLYPLIESCDQVCVQESKTTVAWIDLFQLKQDFLSSIRPAWNKSKPLKSPFSITFTDFERDLTRSQIPLKR